MFLRINAPFFFVPLCRLSLEIMTLKLHCEDVETAQGVAITVAGVAQVGPVPCMWRHRWASTLSYLCHISCFFFLYSACVFVHKIKIYQESEAEIRSDGFQSNSNITLFIHIIVWLCHNIQQLIFYLA